ncbi:hypothetical protein [Flavimarina sp. Hel_I_48]|uniref:hypothetical protein n=1 Tax=Flavimarina sp. Hel_I_48 TaxID=1392488 RepID=UPI0004DF5938|nr:hypothetical protein [Flavimarina sp. Hel_I_48]
MKFKKILLTIWNNIFIVTTVLGVTIFLIGMGWRGKYHLAGKSNIYIAGFGAILTIPFLIYLIRITITDRKLWDENIKRINRLKKTGDKLIINLDELKIHTNSYMQEVSVGSGYNQRNERVQMHNNLIILDIPYRNQRIRFKSNINMEPIKLKLHFAVKGKTELYIDRQDPDNNYFDLTFLNK